MEENIYEVSKDEFIGFLGQIRPECIHFEYDGVGSPHAEVKGFSIDNQRHFTTQIMDDDRGDFYYVFDMPLDEERKPPKKVRKITLDTREEVEAFFQLLNNLHGDKND